MALASAARMPYRAKHGVRDVSFSRRSAAAAALSSTALFQAMPAALADSRSRTDGYPIQWAERDWESKLSEQQYFILRRGGTEPPFSSPLYKEKRSGVFRCAACDVDLFSSKAKFESGTGWPSFASPLELVEVTNSNPIVQALAGTEVRCASCGGHLGDVFLDGFLFPGTAAALTGKRYCIDGAALRFYPADGGPAVLGEAPPSTMRNNELPSWLQPPQVGSGA